MAMRIMMASIMMPKVERDPFVISLWCAHDTGVSKASIVTHVPIRKIKRKEWVLELLFNGLQFLLVNNCYISLPNTLCS